MRRPVFFIPALALATLVLTACGGGGGGGGGSSAVAPTVEPVKLSALQAPAQWPDNFKSATVNQASLVSSTELAGTTNDPKTIFIQVWYLNQEQKRQTVAMLSLNALTQMGGSLLIERIPASVKVLYSEVYTANGSAERTLARKEMGV